MTVGVSPQAPGRTILLAGILALALTTHPVAASSDPIEVSYYPIPLDETAPGTTRVGDLTYRGGLHVTSSDRRFGGISGLIVTQDARHFITVTDIGFKIEGALIHNSQGHLTGVRELNVSPLNGVDGRPLTGKKNTDAESLAVLPDGRMVISFERRHRILVKSRGLRRHIAVPQALYQAPRNSGLEAITALSDGRLLVFTEALRPVAPASNPEALVARGWHLNLAGDWQPMDVQVPRAFKITGATTLTNGDVYVLLRKFSPLTGAAVRVARLPVQESTPANLVQLQTIAEISSPLTVDNFEGIANRTARDGRDYLYIVSDDNFNPLQRTLFLQFEINN